MPNFVNIFRPKRAGITPADGVGIRRAYAETMLSIVCHFFGAGEGLHKTDLRDGSQKFMLVIVMISGRFI